MNNEKEASSGPCWYVIHTNPRQEDRTSNNLQAINIETFTPRLKEQRVNQFTGASTDVIKPLFPRYIFARFEMEKMFYKVRYTRGVYNLISFGDFPTTVDDEIISHIRQRTADDGFVRINETLMPGDTVEVTEGPLKKLTGIFKRQMSDSERVMILLDLVSYQAHIEIDRNYIRRSPLSDCGM